MTKTVFDPNKAANEARDARTKRHMRDRIHLRIASTIRSELFDEPLKKHASTLSSEKIAEVCRNLDNACVDTVISCVEAEIKRIEELTSRAKRAEVAASVLKKRVKQLEDKVYDLQLKLDMATRPKRRPKKLPTPKRAACSPKRAWAPECL
jgi:hypothetical protein